MRILCLGNNTEDTDLQTTQHANANNSINYGLVTQHTDLTNIKDGWYHTSVYDITPGDIVRISKYFDSVMILDQPKELWDHPDAFFNTIKLAKLLPSVLRANTTMFDDYWDNLVKSNNSFCIFPFIELLVQNGSTTVCCRSQTQVTTLEKIKDYKTDAAYESIRSKMLTGIQIPEHCSSCYNIEQKGMQSARQQETVEWANRLNIDTVDDLRLINSPVYYEVRPSNNCNLQCRTCGPVYSKLLQKEYNDLGLHDPQKQYTYTGFEFINISKIKKLYVSGGEPTAMPEFYEFLRSCIADNKTDFEFLVNTNAHKISKTLLTLGKKFSNLQYIVSIDGFKKANDYTRWPSNWKNTIENIRKLTARHKVTFNITLSIYTIFSFSKLIKFLQSEFPESLIHCQYANNGVASYTPFIIKYTDDQIAELLTLKETSIYKGDTLFASFVDNVIRSASNSVLDIDSLRKFFDFNDRLDVSRSVIIDNYILEFKELRTLL